MRIGCFVVLAEDVDHRGGERVDVPVGVDVAGGLDRGVAEQLLDGLQVARQASRTRWPAVWRFFCGTGRAGRSTACGQIIGLSSVVGMGIRDRMVKGATRLGTSAAEAATSRAQRVGSGFKALRAILADEDQPTDVETFLLTLIKSVRDDEPSEQRTRRNVYEDARSRRRRLGMVSFGAGPLVGVATHIVDLYCDIATFCDLVDVYGLGLGRREIAAHMLVMWAIVEPLGDAEAVMDGTGDRTIAAIMAETLRDGAAAHLPANSTKRAVAKALWDARTFLGDARSAAGTGSVGGVVLAGHHTKQFIKKAERQLDIQQKPPRAIEGPSLWARGLRLGHGDVQAAIAAYSQATDAGEQPQQLRAALRHAEQLELRGMHEAAEAAYKLAGESDEADVKAAAWRGIASYLMMRGAMSEGLAALQTIVETRNPRGDAPRASQHRNVQRGCSRRSGGRSCRL